MKKDPLTPEQEWAEELLADIVFGSRNSVTESLDAAIRAADSDAERLWATLMYVHHVYGRTRGDEPFELVFERAHELLRRAVAVSAESGQGLGPNSSSGDGS